jgi:hypothetical protein
VREDALDLVKLRIRRLGRSLVPRLRDAGLLDLDELRRAGPDRVKATIGQRRLVDALFAKLAGREAPEPPHAVQLSLRTGPTAEPVPAKTYPLQEESFSATPALRAAEPAPDATTPGRQANPATDLVIDMPTRKVILWGAELRGKGPKGLQPQLFVALTALALRAGEIVSMADLAVLIQQLDGLPKKPVAPDARDLRYRVLRRLRSLLAEHPRANDLDGIIENISGAGLRLNCTAQVLRARDEILG